MADFSQSPQDLLLANQHKGYVGIHFEQGVPILDRDLNLLHDLVAATVRAVITRYIGNGAPAGADGFAVQALPSGQNSQDFRIAAADSGPGTCLVGGIEVTIPTPITYTSQGLAPLTTPSAAQPDPRIDTVYLDVSLTEVDGTVDTDLTNSLDVGVQTSVRLKPGFVVRVVEGAPVPTPTDPGHVFYPLAQLTRPHGQAAIVAAMITDLRRGGLTVADIERRLSVVESALLMPSFAPPSKQLQPSSGRIRQRVILTGTNFTVGTQTPTVLFGDTVARISASEPPTMTQIVVRVPGGLTPAGTRATVVLKVSNNFGTKTSDDVFIVLPTPAFADPGNQFSPTSGGPDSQVTINGFNFNVGTPQVQFIAASATVTATVVGTPTATQITAKVPAGLVPAGSTSAQVKITVTTPAEGGSSILSDDTFVVAIPAPTFDSPPFSKNSGVGNDQITLNGQNFNFGPVTVKFDTANATIVGTPTSTQIAVLVPTSMTPPGTPKKVKITVSTAGGSVTTSDALPFTVNG